MHYMAPEIANGRYGREIDTYALGIILFEMLTGRVPFEGESVGEVLMKHLTAEPDLTACSTSRIATSCGGAGEGSGTCASTASARWWRCCPAALRRRLRRRTHPPLGLPRSGCAEVRDADAGIVREIRNADAAVARQFGGATNRNSAAASGPRLRNRFGRPSAMARTACGNIGMATRCSRCTPWRRPLSCSFS